MKLIYGFGVPLGLLPLGLHPDVMELGCYIARIVVVVVELEEITVGCVCISLDMVKERE